MTPPLPTYIRDRVALIGDAAHAMTPDLGRGACEAIIDAVTLASCLSQASSIPQGLAAYDRKRRRHTQRLARMSAAASRLSRVRKAPWLRDALLRAAMLAGPPA